MKLQIAESFKFRRCAQNDNESISEFVYCLRKCASSSTCNYETFLERALKEQFTVGLHNKETQLKLLFKEHSLEESIQQAIADEAAFHESAIIVPSSGGTNVNHVKQFPPKKTQVTTNQHSKNFGSNRNLFPQVPTLLLVLPPINATLVVSPITNAVLVRVANSHAYCVRIMA